MIYEFADLQLDVRRRSLTRKSQDVPLPKLSFKVLVALVEAAPDLVSHDDLIERVWGPNRVITAENLTQRMMMLRHAIGDDSSHPCYVEGVRGEGYRLVPAVEKVKTDRSTDVRRRIPVWRQTSVAMLAVALLVAGLYLIAGHIGKLSDEPVQDSRPEKSIAVLPFVNMSDDRDNEYFSDGLSEEILNLLTKIPGLKVIGRTSSFAYKGKNEDLRVIGQTLGVKTVLEGSVRKSGDRVRITTQLIDVSDGSHIWSETYERTMIDIFAVQDDVAAAVIDALQIHVAVNPTRGRPTENTEAYTLFLKARASINNREHRDAKEFVLKAIEFDPNFAEAYELLGDIYWGQAGSELEAAAAQKLMGEAAAKALAIDPGLVFARVMYQIGNIETYSQLAEIEALERAVREVPNDTDAMEALGFPLIKAGYLQEALGVAERMVELEPLKPSANTRLGVTLYAVGHTSEAIAALDVAEQLGDKYARYVIAIMNLADKQDEAAIVHFEAWFQQQDNPDSAWVRELVTGARDPATGQTYLDRRIPQIVASSPEEDAKAWQGALTGWYLYLGLLDRYFELILATDLTDATWTDADNFVYDGTLFRRTGFTAHPKYLEVAESMGLIDVWEQRGPPDFCEKISGKWDCE